MKADAVAGMRTDDAADELRARAGYSLSRDLDRLGDPADALTAAREAVAVLQELLARHPDNKQWTDLEIRTLDFAGGYLDTLSAKDATLGEQASEAYQKAYDLARAAVARNPEDMSILDTSGFAAQSLTVHLATVGRNAEAILPLKEAIAVSDRLVSANPGNQRYRYVEVGNQQSGGGRADAEV